MSFISRYGSAPDVKLVLPVSCDSHARKPKVLANMSEGNLDMIHDTVYAILYIAHVVSAHMVT